MKISERDMEYRSGLMVQSTKATGAKTKPMAGGNLLMLTEISIMEIGKMTKQMVKEHLFIRMEENIKASGKMISKMGLELKLGLMALSLLVIIKREKRRDKAV